MDPLGIVASAFTLTQAAKTSIGRYELIDRALHRCVGGAIRESLRAQQNIYDDLASAILQTLPPAECRRLFLDDELRLGTEESNRSWMVRFRDHVDASGIVDSSIDLSAVASAFSEELFNAVQLDALDPNSPLFRVLVISRMNALSSGLSPHAENTIAEHDKTVGKRPGVAETLSNVAQLPLPLGIVEHPKAAQIRRCWQNDPLVVLAGEPGTGKTVLAQDLILSSDRELVWWFNGSTRGELIASCEALLDAASRVPGDDPIAEVRNMLIFATRFTIVIDDAVDRASLDSLIPGRCSAGSVIVTTRNMHAFPSSNVVELGRLDGVTALALARNHSAGDDEADLDRLIRVSEGNPLVIVSVLRFKVASGSSWSRIFRLLKTKPQYLLSQQDGVGYPASFFEVVTAAFEAASDADDSAALVMTALALCDGEVPRALLELGWITDLAEEGVDGAIQALIASGVIAATSGTISCHSLMTTVANAYYSSATRELVAHLLLRTVQVVSEEERARETHPQRLSAVVDRLERHVNGSDLNLLGARASLSLALSERSWIASAKRQIERILPTLLKMDGTEVRMQLLSEVAEVMLRCGDYRELRNLTCAVLPDASRLDLRIQARLLVLSAWACEGLNDAEGALSAIREACELAPNDPELTALCLYFEPSSKISEHRACSYLEMVDDESLSGMERAFFGSLASRDLQELGRTEEAISVARLALSLDEEAAGPNSQSVARDCNDLGMALLGGVQLSEAAEHLERSQSIYQTEDQNHPLAALPLLQLGRLLHLRGVGANSNSESDRLLRQSREKLIEAERLSRLSSDRSPELASILYARIVVEGVDSAGAAGRINEVIGIDSDYYPPDHPEIGKDRTLALLSAIQQGNSSRAGAQLKKLKPHLRVWEDGSPILVLDIVTHWIRGIESGALPKLSGAEARSFHSLSDRILARPEVLEHLSRYQRGQE